MFQFSIVTRVTSLLNFLPTSHSSTRPTALIAQFLMLIVLRSLPGRCPVLDQSGPVIGKQWLHLDP